MDLQRDHLDLDTPPDAVECDFDDFTRMRTSEPPRPPGPPLKTSAELVLAKLKEAEANPVATPPPNRTPEQAAAAEGLLDQIARGNYASLNSNLARIFDRPGWTIQCNSRAYLLFIRAVRDNPRETGASLEVRVDVGNSQEEVISDIRRAVTTLQSVVDQFELSLAT